MTDGTDGYVYSKKPRLVLTPKKFALTMRFKSGAGKKRWTGECSYCRGTGHRCMKNSNHRW